MSGTERLALDTMGRTCSNRSGKPKEGIMEAVVSITLGTGSYVPVRIGGEPTWQQPVSTVYVDDDVRVLVDGTRSELVTTSSVVDISTDVPASIADDHAAIVAWWSVEIERQEAERETVRLEAAREDTVRRLAAKARAEGVQLYRDARDGRYYASSVSHPGKLHYLTGVSCDCMGFASHGRCKHHSALLVAMGWVVDDVTFEPDPINVVGTGHEQIAA
jgi:hypothetical protein